MELWQFLGDLHPKLVHFPLVLLLAGLLFDLGGLIGRSERSHWAAKALTAAGTVTLLISFICGIYAEIWAGRALVSHHQIELHELAANVASWGFVILAAWRLLLSAANRKSIAIYVTIGLFWYVLLVITAHLGGQLITDYGAAVTGARTVGSPSLHDLNTLATRQTDLNLRYSEMMHHIFGYLTMALSGSLLAAAVFPKRAEKLKWVGPTLLLLGGIFLFFFADLDLYRLTDLRQLRDREVQLHKTISIVLIAVGAAGLRAAKGRAPRVIKAEADRSSQEKDWATLQARLIAIMALIGGGMLFTHVHTVAPYANVAAGVYIAHVVMGLVALSIGASSLLGDALPRWRSTFAVVFALCMLTESILLVSYNEGLPWYIGYGRYNRWGAAGGTVAPFGDFRAELTFDNATQRLDVYLRDRFKDDATDVKSPPREVLISRGYEEVAVPITPVVWGHYSGVAPFLKDTPAFSARMRIPGHPTGYFDPWVTPVIIAVPPNEVARFVCPMHEGIRMAEAGECPLCKMPLAPIDSSPRATLHDPAYAMQFSAPPRDSARAVTFKLTPTKDGHVVRDLARVHEYLMHLIVVSDDLSFFDHVHPQQQEDGSFTLSYTFPRDGKYLLFADVTPSGARSQVFRLPIDIGAASQASVTPASLTRTAAPAMPLAADPSTVVELMPTPRTLAAGTHAQLVFRLARNGRPITDLSPYIGAMGHCVIISQDTHAYLHCHPEQLLPPGPDDRGGPDVAFHTTFPKPGRYKVWGQFKRADQILVADFVIDVADPLVPARLMNFFLDD